jgi:hypothetical protein
LGAQHTERVKYFELLDNQSFKEDFYNGFTINDLCKKYNLKHGPIRKAIKELNLVPTKETIAIRKENSKKKQSESQKNRFDSQEQKEAFYKNLSKMGRKKNFSVISKLNLSISKELKDMNIDNNLEKQIGDYSYDIQIGKTVLEINPSISHSFSKSFYDITGFGSDKKKDKNYHLLKTMNARKNGFDCIIMWDWDDKNKILNMFQNKEKVFARKTKLREIDKQEANEFLSCYHLQGKCRGNSINIGLYYKDELVQVMTFGKPRYNKKYDWELLRLCSKKGFIVVGGANKIFSYFIKNYCGSIISYCDISKFDGKVYEKLGFNLLRQTQPTKHWFNSKTNEHITHKLLLQRGYDQLFNTNYGKGTSNEKLMLKNGFLDVYDCGQKVFTYDRK